MTWNSQEQGVVATVDGDIDLITAEPLESYLGQVATLAGPDRPLILDMRQVQFLSMAGLRVLADVRVRCAKLGAAVIVVARHPAVCRPIELADLDDVLVVVSRMPAPGEW
jgi:anti-anti-sigma factor